MLAHRTALGAVLCSRHAARSLISPSADPAERGYARGGAAWGGPRAEGRGRGAGPAPPGSLLRPHSSGPSSARAGQGEAGARMLEVHIPSVGPEAEAPRQSPEKSHMVSGSNGLEGARGPAGAERSGDAARNGDPAPRTGRS